MLRKLPRVLFSFEMVFVLYLFAGRYKTDPRFDWVPIDLTLLFLLLSVAIGAWVLLRRELRVRRSALTLTGYLTLFLSYCLISYYWTPSEAYATEKLLYLWILTFWSFLACAFIISRSLERLKRFAAALVLFSLWVAVESVLEFAGMTVAGQQVSTLGSSYLGLGRIIGLAALILLMYGTVIEKHRTTRWGALLLFAGYVFLLLVLGGRGPFLATCLPMLVPIFYGIQWKGAGRIAVMRHTKSLIALLAVGVLAVSLLASSFLVATLERMAVLFSGPLGPSNNIRLALYQQSIQIWSQNPLFGVGVGGWPVLAGWGDTKMYPHNMILEVLAELGLTGLSLLCLPIGAAFWKLRKHHDLRRSPWSMLVLLLFLNTFLNAMVTGDLTDNRVVFAFLGLFLFEGGHAATSSSPRPSSALGRLHRSA